MKESCNDNQTYLNRLLLVCALFSLVALACSFLAEYWWKIEPCKLCKLQRLPFFCIFGLVGYGFVYHRNRSVVWAVRFFLMVSVALAVYHLLMQAKIIPDPCSVPTNIQSMDDFTQLLDAPPPCSKVALKFLGVPIAAFSIGFSSIFLLLLQKCRKLKHSRPVHKFEARITQK